MILYCQGRDVVHGGQSGGLFEPASQTPLGAGDVILIELDAVYRGYKAQFNQIFVMGEPDEEWQRIFDTATTAFAAGVEALKAGTTLGELEDAMIGPIGDAGFTFGNPAFHGLGLGLEWPIGTYPRAGYEVDRSVVVEESMVLEFEPHPTTRDHRRGASLGCPVLVTNDGCRLLAKRWRPEPVVL